MICKINCLKIRTPLLCCLSRNEGAETQGHSIEGVFSQHNLSLRSAVHSAAQASCRSPLQRDAHGEGSPALPTRFENTYKYLRVRTKLQHAQIGRDQEVVR
jgi:hypothetical protein